MLQRKKINLIIFILSIIIFSKCICGEKIIYHDENNGMSFNIYKDTSKELFFGYLENDWKHIVQHSFSDDFLIKKYNFVIASYPKSVWDGTIENIKITIHDDKNNRINYSEIVYSRGGESKSFKELKDLYKFLRNEDLKCMIYFLYPKEVIEGHDVLYFDFQIKMIFEGEKIDFKTHKKISVKKEYLTFFDVWE